MAPKSNKVRKGVAKNPIKSSKGGEDRNHLGSRRCLERRGRGPSTGNASEEATDSNTLGLKR